MALDDTGRLAAYANQADRSRELAEGYVRQAMQAARQVMELRDIVAKSLRTINIPHRWNGTNLELQDARGEWVPGPNLKGEPGADAFGTVNGPAHSTAGHVAVFDDDKGTQIADAGIALAEIALISALAAVAISGDYSDLSGLPDFGALAGKDRVSNGDWEGDSLSIANGGTGASTKEGALANLGAEPAIGFTPENSTNKGAPGGYASLGGDGLLSESQRPPAAIADGAVSRPKLASTAYSTQGEAETGTLGTGAMSPLRVAQSIAARRGVANGVASLGSDGRIPPSQVPVPDYGAVGSYVIAASVEWVINSEYLPGLTVSGSSLVRSTASNVDSSPLSSQSATSLRIPCVGTQFANLGLSGTWRLMTRVFTGSAQSNSLASGPGLFVRIA